MIAQGADGSAQVAHRQVLGVRDEPVQTVCEHTQRV
jgi:hypothetical protein